jgi:hypothetical protein
MMKRQDLYFLLTGLMIMVSHPTHLNAAITQDPRVAAALEGVRARERRLQELTVTYELEVRPVLRNRGHQPKSGVGVPPIPTPPAGKRLLVTWSRKGSRMVTDERYLRSTTNPKRTLRRRQVYDGKTCLVTEWHQGQAVPELYVTDGRNVERDMRQKNFEVGLSPRVVPIEDLFREARRVGWVGYERLGHDRCAVLDLHNAVRGTNRTRLWFDLGRGFLLRQAVSYDVHGIASEALATEPREWVPGEFLATRLVYRAYPRLPDAEPQLLHNQWTTTVQRVRVGGLPDELFVTTPPAGQQALDTRTGMLFGQRPRYPSEPELNRLADRARVLLRSPHIVAERVSDRSLLSNDPDCGPQCLYIICRALGVRASITELRRLAKTGRGGTSLLGLMEAARAKGLSAQGVRIPFSEIRRMSEPAIAVVPGHYYVLLGFNRSTAVVVNPPSDVVSVPADRLKRFWDGRALLVRRENG